MICSFRNSSLYHFRVKPPHLALVFDWLKESTTSVTIGAYNKIKIRVRYIFCKYFLIKMLTLLLLYRILQQVPYLQ